MVPKSAVDMGVYLMNLEISLVEQVTSERLMALPTFRYFNWEMFGIDTISF